MAIRSPLQSPRAECGMHANIRFLLDEETVGIALVLRSKYGQQKAEEERHGSEATQRHNLFLAGFLLHGACLTEQYHPHHHGSIQKDDDVGFNDELSLAASMDVVDLAGLGILVHEGRAADVIPHLTRCHRKYQRQSDDSPGGFVVEKLKVVSLEVEHPPR